MVRPWTAFQPASNRRSVIIVSILLLPPTFFYRKQIFPSCTKLCNVSRVNMHFLHLVDDGATQRNLLDSTLSFICWWLELLVYYICALSAYEETSLDLICTSENLLPKPIQKLNWTKSYNNHPSGRCVCVMNMMGCLHLCRYVCSCKWFEKIKLK